MKVEIEEEVGINEELEGIEGYRDGLI